VLGDEASQRLHRAWRWVSGDEVDLLHVGYSPADDGIYASVTIVQSQAES
jgi:hypothetical protein